MGSDILTMLDGGTATPILGEVPRWFEEWERVLSRFRLDSELSHLNAKLGAPTVVSETLWEVYSAALEAERISHSLVNPLVLNAVISAGYSRSFDEFSRDALRSGALLSGVDSPDELRTGPLPSCDAVLVDAHKRTLQLPEGVGLDFGGVAKGWAAHQAMRRLSAVGPALVSGGGDIAISGPPSDGEPWPIDVVNPLEPSSFLETVFLDRGGVATSGRDRRHRNPAGIPKHHVIDPRTGVPAQTDVLTATVVGPTVMQAEALAKAVMISGSQAGLAWLDHDEAFEGLLVLEDGQQLYSRNFEKYL